jgi:hypothetical protein
MAIAQGATCFGQGPKNNDNRPYKRIVSPVSNLTSTTSTKNFNSFPFPSFAFWLLVLSLVRAGTGLEDPFLYTS